MSVDFSKAWSWLVTRFWTRSYPGMRPLLAVLGLALCAEIMLARVQYLHTVPILAASGLILLYYTHATERMRRTGFQDATFSALSSIHGAMSNETTYAYRAFLHNYGLQKLRDALRQVYNDPSHRSALGALVDSCGRINPAAFDSLDTSDEQTEALRRAALVDFHKALNPSVGLVTEGARVQPRLLDALEGTLLSYDALTIPVWLQIEAALAALEAYRPVFDSTAPILLQFVAVQMYLRSERSYKFFYLHALQQLDRWNALNLERPERELFETLTRLVTLWPKPHNSIMM